MYCKFCGKQTDNQDGVCDSCAMRHSGAGEEGSAESALRAGTNTDRMLGFGKALTAAILSVVGFLFAFVAFFIICGSRVSQVYIDVVDGAYTGELHPFGDGEILVNTLITGIVLSGLSVPPCIIGIIFGIRSIVCFRETCNTGGVKPIATLVLGIVALAGAALAFVFVFLGMTFGGILCTQV